MTQHMRGYLDINDNDEVIVEWQKEEDEKGRRCIVFRKQKTSE